MRQKQKCIECGQDYSTKMLTIYVLKQHTCPNDKTPLIISEVEGKKVYACIKCRKMFSKDVPSEYNAMGIKIQGSTRDFLVRDKRLAEDSTLESDKVPVPEETMCQKCRNYKTKAEQATKKRENKLAIGLPDDLQMIPNTVSNADIYKYEIFRKTQEEFQETRKAEAYAKQKADREAAEKERQARITEQAKIAQLPTKEEMQTLIEPEMIAIEKEAQATDIRIAEFKSKQEEAKKLKENIEKTDEEIAKLKEQLKLQNKE
jgi:hypothetical protein